MGGDRLVIAVTGDFDPAAVTAQVRQAFGGWARAGGSLPQVTAKARETGRRVLLVDKPGATQSYFALANIGSQRGDPAEAAQDLVQTAFGGRFTSMLKPVRIKSGLSYGAVRGIDRTALPARRHTASTRPNAQGARTRHRTSGADKDGMDAATWLRQAYIAGQFAPQLETAPQLAATLVDLALHAEERDRVDGYLGKVAAATPERVAAARSVFANGNELVIVAIGDAARIRGDLKAYGPLTEMKLTDPRFVPLP